MSKVKGITLEIGGDATEFNRAVQEADKSSRDLGKEIAEINKGLKFSPDSVELLGQKATVTGERLEVAKNKLAALKDQQKAVEEAFKNGDMGAEEYRKFCREVETAESQVKNFTKQHDAANKAYKEHTSVLGKAKTAVKQFGDEHPKAAKAINTAKEAAQKFASAGAAAVKTAAAGATAAVGALAAGAVALGKAIFDSAKEASEYGDQVDKASQKMGVSAEEYQKLAYAADMSGTSINTLQAATVKLQKAGSDLNISEALDQLYAIEDADERAAAAHEMFGDKIANELAPMLAEGADGFNAMKQAASDFGLVMSDEAVAASAQFDDTLTTMTGTFSMIKTNLASELLPGINEVMEGVTGLFTGDDSAMGKIENGINTFFEDLNGKDGVISKVTNIFKMITDTIIEMAPTLIPELITGLLSSIGQLADAALEIVSALVNGLFTEENMTELANGAVQLINDIVTFLSQNISIIVNGAVALVTGLVNAFSDPENMHTLLDGAIQLITELSSALITNAPDLISAAIEMVTTLANELIHYDWWGVAKQIFNAIKEAIKGLMKIFAGGDDDEEESSSKKGSDRTRKKDSRNNKHAGGLDFVPYDNYPAQLHQGEAVITAAENAERKAQNVARDEQIFSIERRLDRLTDAVRADKNPSFEVRATGSYSQLLRQMQLDFKRISRADSAW